VFVTDGRRPAGLQRCLRDIHTAGQHVSFSDDAWGRHARHRFGIPQPTFMY